MKFEEKTLERETVFKGKFFDVVVDKVALPENKGESRREMVLHNGAVAVLAVTPEDKIILVKQYRKPIEKVTYEIPAGKLESTETGAEKLAALRELEEETGYIGELEFISSFYTAIGFCNAKTHLFWATNLMLVEKPKAQDFDETVERLEVTYEECQRMMSLGQIEDAKTIIALQYYAMNLGGKKDV